MNARSLFVILLAASLWCGGVLADSVRLKTGETFEGTILSETETNIRIEVEYASGSILSTEVFNKDEIAEIARSTPEQLAQRAMERAYANTQKYRLDLTHNYTPNYYQMVIDRVLQRFLTDYPDSPYTNTVQTKLKEWTAEQGMVANGSRKYHGVWMRADEATRQNAEAHPAADRAKATEAAAVSTSSQRDVLDQVGGFLRQYWAIAL